MEKLEKAIKRIGPLDEASMAAARRRLDSLTKPQGSLGVLEEICVSMAGITGSPMPALPKKTCVVMAGDHGVCEEGVNAFPQEVTCQMVLNFLAGGAAINVLAAHAGAEVIVVDAGVKGELPAAPNLLNRKVAPGTANLAKGPAMSREQVLKALEVGLEVAEQLADAGVGLIGLGEMGIGNSTASAALLAALSGRPPREVVGPGTGLDQAGMEKKRQVVARALEANKMNIRGPLETLAALGGLEIAALAGLAIGSAGRRVPVVVDGLISGAAAAAAAALAPGLRPYLLASHLSQEPGHRVALELLGLKPLLLLEMRLGEGTGAALVMTLVDAALKIMGQMATFEQAGVAGALD